MKIGCDAGSRIEVSIPDEVVLSETVHEALSGPRPYPCSCPHAPGAEPYPMRSTHFAGRTGSRRAARRSGILVHGTSA